MKLALIMGASTYFLIVHTQNKTTFQNKRKCFLVCLLLNNDIIFTKETMYKLVSNQTLMYISKLIHCVNHSESKIKYNYRLFSIILDYEIGF